MKPLKFLSQWFPPLLFIFSTSILASPYQIPRLSPVRLKFSQEKDSAFASSASNDDFQTYFYQQILDHFNYGPESYSTFKQKYIISSKYWGGADSNSPIFAYPGAESALTNGTINTIGFITDNAPRFKALLVYIEHRFYGDSIPFGISMEEAMKNASTRGYFSSAQAIADYAEVLLHVKETFSASGSPVIVIGGSYGGSSHCLDILQSRQDDPEWLVRRRKIELRSSKDGLLSIMPIFMPLQTQKNLTKKSVLN